MNRTVAIALIGLAISADNASAQTKADPSLDISLRDQSRVRVIVLTRPDPDQADGGASIATPASYLSSQLGATARNVSQISQLPLVTAEIDEAGLALLRNDPNVALVVEDVPVPAVLFDSVEMIGADKLHEKGILGAQTAVAVLDTGIEAGNAALKDSIVAQACFSTVTSTVYNVQSLCPSGLDMSLLDDAATGCPVTVEGCHHGTHVAGIVGGHDMRQSGEAFGGVSPAARILPIQVFTLFDGDPCVPGPKCVRSFTSDQLRALDWIYKRRDDFKIASVNMSLGGGYRDNYCDATSPLTQTIERLRAKGILTVIAAGNDHYYDGVSEPACISAAISVSATTKAGAIDVSYSNMAPIVDIAAPGTDIVSSVFGGQLRALSGTSMAAPHVAGTIALLREQFPSATAIEIETMLQKATTIVRDPRTDTKVGLLSLAALNQSSTNSEPPADGGDIDPSTVTAAADMDWRFILEGGGSQQTLMSTLDGTCADYSCELKSIGKDKYILEMRPKTNADVRVLKPLSTRVLQNVFSQGGNSGIKVYSDNLSIPLQ